MNQKAEGKNLLRILQIVPSNMKTAAGRVPTLPAAVYFSRGRAIPAGRESLFPGRIGEMPAPAGQLTKNAVLFPSGVV